MKKAIALIESGQLENAIQHLYHTGAIQVIPWQALGAELRKLKFRLGQQQRLTTTASELVKRLEIGGDLNQLLKKRYYRNLWAHYSQGVQSRNLCELDAWIARRAFADGLSKKDVGLMLIARSAHVREIYQQTGKHQAMLYVKQTFRNLERQQMSRNFKKQQYQVEL